MLSLENIISDNERNVSNKQEKFGVNPYSGYDFAWNYMLHHNNIKKAVFPPPPPPPPPYIENVTSQNSNNRGVNKLKVEGNMRSVLFCEAEK